MTGLNASQALMLLGLILIFGGYFALTFRKYQKGKAMIIAKDKRLYPDNYAELQKSDRKRLYRTHTWKEAWDEVGKAYAGVSVVGIVMFILSLII
ncbi:MAG: hypothetical protein WBC71_14665 [Salaquimonas sp.]